VSCQVRIGDTDYDGGCVTYADLAEEQALRDRNFELLMTYLLAAIGSAIIIALIIVICAT